MIHWRPMQSNGSQRVENHWSDSARTHTEGLQHFRRNYSSLGAPLVVQTVENLPAMRKTRVQSQAGKIPWRRAWQPTPVFLPGEFPWTEEPGGLQSMGSQRVGCDWAQYSTCLLWVFIAAWAFSSCGSRGCSLSRCAGSSLRWLLLLRLAGSRAQASVLAAHGLSCSTACGIFLNWGSNPCPLC